MQAALVGRLSLHLRVQGMSEVKYSGYISDFPKIVRSYRVTLPYLSMFLALFTAFPVEARGLAVPVGKVSNIISLLSSILSSIYTKVFCSLGSITTCGAETCDRMLKIR